MTCNRPHSVHPVHGRCVQHSGFMHTTVKNGKTFGWPDQVLNVMHKPVTDMKVDINTDVPNE